MRGNWLSNRIFMSTAMAQGAVARLGEAVRSDLATQRAMQEMTGKERVKHLLLGMINAARRQKELGEMGAVQERKQQADTAQRSAEEQARNVLAPRDLAGRRGEARSAGAGGAICRDGRSRRRWRGG